MQRERERERESMEGKTVVGSKSPNGKKGLIRENGFCCVPRENDRDTKNTDTVTATRI